MANPIRKFIDSIVFAGLKPDSPSPAYRRWRWLGPLGQPLERFLSGGPAPSDPLYLTNRTWGQKLKLTLVIAVPCLVIAGGILMAFSRAFAPEAPLPDEPTAAEIAARVLPDLEKTVKIERYEDAELDEIRVDRSGPPSLTGFVQNKTGRAISVEFLVDLADQSGSRIGAEAERVNMIPPHARAPFSFPLRVPKAVFAIVRELRTVD